ncbi:MAG: hypothetical protein IKU70_01665 [Clostridia bacterium]|nr:hypothetical protein [Clostridia bacterium]
MFKNRQTATRIISLIFCVTFFALSIGAASPYFSSPKAHMKAINKLDEKKSDATAITSALTIASLGLSAVGEDTATPLAEELADLTGPLMLIVCILYAEKFLLTTSCHISFTYLIPTACALMGIYIFIPKVHLKKIAFKILVFAIAIVLLVPASVKLTDMVEETFEDSIASAINKAKKLAHEIIKADANENSGFFEKLFEGISDTVTFVMDIGKTGLSIFIDGIAVMLITTCAIPLLTLLIFSWLMKTIFSVQIRFPSPEKLPNLPKHLKRFKSSTNLPSTEK